MHQISNIYFLIKLYMFRATSVPIIRSYLLYARQLVRFMQAMWPLTSTDRLELQFQPVSARKWSHSLHETYQLPCIQQITPDNGHRRCPKHAQFYDKIYVGYLMHLAGCFTRSTMNVFLRCDACLREQGIYSMFITFCKELIQFVIQAAIPWTKKRRLRE